MSNTPITKFAGNSATVTRISPVVDTNTTSDYDLAIDGNKGAKMSRTINTINGNNKYVSTLSSGNRIFIATNGKFYTLADAENNVLISGQGTNGPSIGTDTQIHTYFRNTRVTNV